MISYIFSADWRLDDAAQNWLKTAYAPQMLNRALASISFAEIRLTINPLYQNMDLYIHLKPTTWLDEFGRGDAGLYRYPTLDDATHRIEVAWDKEMVWNTILQHEMAHFILLANSIPGWEVFQHGMNAAPPSKDLYLAKIVEYARRAYPKNHSSDPLKVSVDPVV